MYLLVLRSFALASNKLGSCIRIDFVIDMAILLLHTANILYPNPSPDMEYFEIVSGFSPVSPDKCWDIA